MDTKVDGRLEEKKSYEAPVVKKVRLVSKDAVLGTCNTSTILTPWRDGFPQGACKGYCAN